MAIRQSGLPPCVSQRLEFASAILGLPVALLLALAAAGCASPGVPIARKPLVPQPVTNLTATQSGNSVLLAFAVPRISVAGAPLDHAPTVQIYREFESSSAANEAQPAQASHPALLTTVPSELVPRYVTQGKFRYSDPLNAADLTDHPNTVVVYSVRSRASEKKISAPSNLAELHVYPAPEPISDLSGQVAPAAIVLIWSAPPRTPVGPTPPIAAYRIYRAESQEVPSSAGTDVSALGSPANRASTPQASTPLPGLPPAPPALKTPLVKIGESASPGFRDAGIELGKTYVYSVRSVFDYSGTTIESSDSNFVMVAPRAALPPAAPMGIIGVLVPAAANTVAHVDLSWDVSQEANVAGYRVYRSEQAGVQGTLLTPQQLLTPAFRDMNVTPGHRYFYTVAAVDRSGNESASSPAASISVP
ncbi:MAG: fibronectin type III domain-containing protein [Acidobacteriota bacterium]|nr:fibronectin type III domain-containing protein [Acidobacteriota bacterium]